MTIYYVAHFEGDWSILGYAAQKPIDALKQARKAYPLATEYRIFGTKSGHPHPLPDKTVYLGEAMINIFWSSNNR